MLCTLPCNSCAGDARESEREVQFIEVTLGRATVIEMTRDECTIDACRLHRGEEKIERPLEVPFTLSLAVEVWTKCE